MKLKIPVCPECNKEIFSETNVCHNCSEPLNKEKYIEIFSWHWSERIFLFSIILLFTSFFLPWFPGKILLKENPVSPFIMLLNLYDVDISFLESYNILRMTLIVPIFSTILFLFYYYKKNIITTPYPKIFIFLAVLIISIKFIFDSLSSINSWIFCVIFICIYISYYIKGQINGFLFRSTYYLSTILLIISLFLFFLNLYNQYYINIDTIKLSNTYGFWLAWLITIIMLTISYIYNMRSFEDFWLLVFILIFSIIYYKYITEPMFFSGPLRCYADNFSKTGQHIITHLKIVGLSLIIAIISGVPIGVYITKHPKVANIILYITSVIITIPSIAMFGFMMPILSTIDKHCSFVQGIGIGMIPAIAALSLYSLLPIIRNTYIAINNVDKSIIEAGIGMGMTNFQLLLKVEIPLSAQIIMAGIRTSVVMGIAIAALAAYIGAGGLGDFVIQGLQRSTNDYVMAGAISMGLLAIICDLFLKKLEDCVTPTGLKIKLAN